jgi:hypothetical protein
MTERGAQPPLASELHTELIAELANKSDRVWVQVADGAPRPVWSVWHETAVAVVTGGAEQPNPGLADQATVTIVLRSKENRARQVAVVATVEQLVAGSEAWDATVQVLHPKRLNASDGERQPERWARESQVWLLHPTPQVVEQPGSYSDSSLRAAPLPTSATTITRTPFHAGRATKKRR